MSFSFWSNSCVLFVNVQASSISDHSFLPIYVQIQIRSSDNLHIKPEQYPPTIPLHSLLPYTPAQVKSSSLSNEELHHAPTMCKSTVVKWATCKIQVSPLLTVICQRHVAVQLIWDAKGWVSCLTRKRKYIKYIAFASIRSDHFSHCAKCHDYNTSKNRLIHKKETGQSQK